MRPGSRPSTSPASRCPKGSATWPGTTSMPPTPPSIPRTLPPSCSSWCTVRGLGARRPGQRWGDALEAGLGVASVRGLGLLLGVELSGGEAKAVAARLLDDGLVVNPVTDTALRLAPSLLVTDDELDEAVTLIAKALS